MKNLNPQLIDYIFTFMNEHRLLGQKRFLLAVSCGCDSVFLLRLFCEFLRQKKILSIRVIHINHGQREQSRREQEWLQSLCDELAIEMKVEVFNGGKNCANFEKQARDFRYQKFYHHKKNDEYIVTAHHLDDSYEWSLMQQSRSSELASSLGIPCWRNGTVRPLLCVSKQQILHQLAILKQSYWHDLSNDSLQYDRNYIRHKVIAPLVARYPQYLKHYVYRQNQLAKTLGLHRKKITRAQIKIWEKPGEGGLFFCRIPSGFTQLRDTISKALKGVSKSQRGVWQKQLDRLIQMPTGQATGPLLFSGRVQAFAQKNTILICSQDRVFSLKKPTLYPRCSFFDYQKLLLNHFDLAEKFDYYPFWVEVVCVVSFSLPGSQHPLYPVSDKRKFVTAFDLLRIWSRKSKMKKVRLDLKLYF